jgi:hypothetical protein
LAGLTRSDQSRVSRPKADEEGFEQPQNPRENQRFRPKAKVKPEGILPEVIELAQALAALPPEMRAALLALAKGK